MRQKKELHPGEHEPIVELDVFESVQKMLSDRSLGRGSRHGARPDFLLTGVLRCQACNAAMTSSLARGANGKRYRYYRCSRQAREGGVCPTGLIAADQIESRVVAEVREAAKKGELQKAILADLNQDDGSRADAEAQRGRLTARLAELNDEARRLLAAFSNGGAGSKLMVDRLGELETDMDGIRHELADVEDRLRTADAVHHDVERVAEFLDGFDALWSHLVPEERRELLHVIVRQVSVDAATRQLHVKLFDLEALSPAPVAPAAAAAEATP